jgi:hypothetical protein
METRGGGGDGMLGHHPYFDIRQSCQLHALAAFTPKETLWYSFLSEVKWTPMLLNADRIRSTENFQGPHRKPKPGHCVLWRTASTNCAQYVCVCVCTHERMRNNSLNA